MLAMRSPHEAYRRVDFDARVAGADPGQLVTLCYEQLISALGTAVYANGLGDLVNDGFYAYPIEADPNMTDADRFAAIDSLLRDAIQKITASGKRVVLLFPLPDPGFNVPDRMARKLWQTGTVPATVSIPLSVFQAYSADTLAIFDSAANQPGVTRLDLGPLFCDPATGCDAVRDGRPLYFDANHLSLAGSALVVPPLADAVRTALGPGD